MERKCFEELCTKQIAFSCSLGKSYFYSCEKHVGQIMIENKNYKIKPILVKFPIEEKTRILNKIQEILEFLTNLINKNNQFTSQLINKIIKSHKTFESKILDTIKDIRKLSSRIIDNKTVNKKLSKWVSNINQDFINNALLSIPINYDLKNIYDNTILMIKKSDCENMLFIKEHTKELKIIDLNNYNVTSPIFLKDKKFGSNFSLCKLKNDSFFYCFALFVFLSGLLCPTRPNWSS